MAHMGLEGMEEYLELLIQTDKQTDRMCGRSIYPGAKLISNAVKTALKNVKTDDTYHKFAEMYGRKHGITKKQLAGLIESMGIAKMRHRADTYDVKLGFDGYNNVITRKFPYGQPNALIARSLNKGTSFLQAQPFMDSTVEANRAAVEEAIRNQFNKELEKLWSRQSAHF